MNLLNTYIRHCIGTWHELCHLTLSADVVPLFTRELWKKRKLTTLLRTPAPIPPCATTTWNTDLLKLFPRASLGVLHFLPNWALSQSPMGSKLFRSI